MLTLHAVCQELLLKYFLKRLKFCKICENKNQWKFSAIQYVIEDSHSNGRIIGIQGNFEHYTHNKLEFTLDTKGANWQCGTEYIAATI